MAVATFCRSLPLSGVDLKRTRNAGSSAFNRLDESLNPRIARFGLRPMF